MFQHTPCIVGFDKDFLNVPGDQNVTEREGASSRKSVANKWWRIDQNNQKNMFLFSHLDLGGRCGERDLFVIFLLLASADSRVSSSMVELLGSLFFICKFQAVLDCSDTQRLPTCSDKCRKSSVISIKMKTFLWGSILLSNVDIPFLLCQALSATPPPPHPSGHRLRRLNEYSQLSHKRPRPVSDQFVNNRFVSQSNTVPRALS